MSDFLRAEPLIVTRNLLRHSATKSRAGARKHFDDTVEKETADIFAGVIRWFARHAENEITSLRLNSEMLSYCSPDEKEIIAGEMISAASILGDSLQSLGSLLDASPHGELQLETISLPVWLEDLQKDFRIQLREADMDLVFYAEQISIRTSPTLLRAALSHMLHGISRLAASGSALDFKAGRCSGGIEFRITSRVPGLTDFTARRLFRAFVSHEADPDAELSLWLARRHARVLGGEASVKERSGEYLTMALFIART